MKKRNTIFIVAIGVISTHTLLCALDATAQSDGSNPASAPVNHPAQHRYRVPSSRPNEPPDLRDLRGLKSTQSSLIRRRYRPRQEQKPSNKRAWSSRSNPFSAPLTQYKKFPLQRGSAHTEVTVEPVKKKPIKIMVPPPPPGAIRPADLIPHGNMVPPPPTGDGDMLSLKELPSPPEKPSLSGKLKLIGIVGNRAVFTFSDGLLRLQHNWPHYLTLAAGEQFEGVTVMNISPDAVTVEEDGEKQTKELPRVR